MAQQPVTHGLPLAPASGPRALSLRLLDAYNQAKLYEHDEAEKQVHVEELRARLHKVEQKGYQAHQAKEVAEADLARWMTYASETRKEAELIKSEVSRLEGELVGLKAEHEHLVAESVPMGEVTAIKEQLEVALKTVDTLSEQAIEGKNLHDQLRSEATKLKHRLADKSTALFVVRSKLEDVEDAGADVCEERDSFMDNLEEVEQQILDLELTVRESSEDNAQLEDENGALQQRLHDAEAQVQQRDDRLAALHKTHGDDMSRLRKTHGEELGNLRETHGMELDGLRTANAALQAANEDLRRKLSDAEITLKDLWEERKELKARTERMAQVKGNLERQLAEQPQAVIKLKKQLKECMHENTEVHELQKRDAAKLAKELVDSANLQVQLAASTGREHALVEQVKKLADSCTTLQAAHDESQKGRTVLGCLTAHLSTQASAAETEIKQLWSDLRSKEDTIGRYLWLQVEGLKLFQPSRTPAPLITSPLPPPRQSPQDVQDGVLSTCTGEPAYTPAVNSQLPSPQTPSTEDPRIKFSLRHESARENAPRGPRRARTPLASSLRAKPAVPADPRLHNRAASGQSVQRGQVIVAAGQGVQERPAKRVCFR